MTELYYNDRYPVQCVCNCGCWRWFIQVCVTNVIAVSSSQGMKKENCVCKRIFQKEIHIGMNNFKFRVSWGMPVMKCFGIVLWLRCWLADTMKCTYDMKVCKSWQRQAEVIMCRWFGNRSLKWEINQDTKNIGFDFWLLYSKLNQDKPLIETQNMIGDTKVLPLFGR